MPFSWFDGKTGRDFGEPAYDFTGADFRRADLVWVWAKPVIYDGVGPATIRRLQPMRTPAPSWAKFDEEVEMEERAARSDALATMISVCRYLVEDLRETKAAQGTSISLQENYAAFKKEDRHIKLLEEELHAMHALLRGLDKSTEVEVSCTRLGWTGKVL